jgi:hypothetical protein
VIKNLHISRFKSIKELDLDCRRINLFIGEPNTGKSNILETLGMLSFLRYGEAGESGNARQFFRFERLGNLFYDEVLDEPVEIRCDDMELTVGYRDGMFSAACQAGLSPFSQFWGDYSDIETMSGVTDIGIGRISPFKFYRFRVQESFPWKRSDILLPPAGENLLSLLVSNRELRSLVNLPFQSQGLRLGLRPQEGKIEVIKEFEEGLIISYPYSLVSETLQRLTFYMSAIRSNKDSVIVFEEPEAHSFPYHTKYLAEVISLDDSGNQYFIATHNPYFLMPLLEKTPKEEIAVHIVYYEDYQTKTRELTPEDLIALAEIDVFFNLERFLDPE